MGTPDLAVHRLTSRVDLDELERRISDHMGFAVAVISRQPTDDEPGVLRFEYMGTEDPVDIDARLVVSVVDGLVRDQNRASARNVTRNPDQPDPDESLAPDVPRSLLSAEQALAEAAAATTADEKVDAIVSWIQREVDIVNGMLGRGDP